MASNKGVQQSADDWQDVPHQDGHDDWVDVPHEQPPKGVFATMTDPVALAAATDKLVPKTGVAREMKERVDTQLSPEHVGELAAATLPFKVTGGLEKFGPVIANGLQSAAAGMGGATMKDRATGGATSGLLGLLAGGAGKLLNKVGDYTMQKAVGQSDYRPGLGTTLAEDGVVGTKGMMRKQTARNMETAGNDIGAAAAEISSPIDSASVAQNVRELQAKQGTSGGTVPLANKPGFDKLGEMADDIASRGQVPATEAAEFRRLAGGRGYRNGNELASLLGQADRAEQAGYSKALKSQYAAEHPDLPNKMAEADQRYGANASANRSLNTKEDIANVLKTMLLRGGAGAGLGYLADGNTGAAIGAAAGTPLGMSLIGQGATRLGAASKLAPRLMPALTKKRDER